MRLVTFLSADGQRPGVVDGKEIVDLGAAFESTNALIGGGAQALAAVSEAISSGARVPLEGTRLAAPFVPENIFCVGWNYQKHFEEGAARRGEELPEHPAFFSKSRTSVIGPYDDIPSHAGVTGQLDWEAELAVVIGKRGRDLTAGNALEHVFGYTVANDVSARDLQLRHGGQWIKGKSLDGTCPLGPWIVTHDEITDPQDVVVYCSVNAVEKQRSTTAAMIFPVADLLVRLSEGMTLIPGDVLLTGTPEGVGKGREPEEYLEAGDVVVCGVEGLGELNNRVA